MQAVFDDKANGRVNDASGIVAAASGQIGRAGVEVLTASGAVMLGEAYDEIAGAPGKGISEIVESAPFEPIAIGTVTASGTRTTPVIASMDADLGFGQIRGIGDSESRIRSVFAGSCHGKAPGRNRPPEITCQALDLFIDFARFRY